MDDAETAKKQSRRLRERGGPAAEPGYYRKPGGLPICGQHANLAGDRSEEFYALASALDTGPETINDALKGPCR